MTQPTPMLRALADEIDARALRHDPYSLTELRALAAALRVASNKYEGEPTCN